MGVEATRLGLGQVDAVTQMALADLAVPREGREVHMAAGQEIAGVGQSIEQRVTAIGHQLEIARRALAEIDGNNQKIKSLLTSLPSGEHTIAEAVEGAEREVDKLKEVGIFAALR